MPDLIARTNDIDKTVEPKLFCGKFHLEALQNERCFLELSGPIQLVVSTISTQEFLGDKKGHNIKNMSSMRI